MDGSVVGILLINKEGKVLLQHRDSHPKNYPNKWALFGGFIDPGEGPQEAVIRECKEELGYDLEKPVKIYEGPHIGKRFYLHLFLERYNPKKPLTQMEGDYMGWFSIDEIPKLDSQFETFEIFELVKKYLNP